METILNPNQVNPSITEKIITVYTSSIEASIDWWLFRKECELLHRGIELGVVRWIPKNTILRFEFWPIDGDEDEYDNLQPKTLWETIKDKITGVSSGKHTNIVAFPQKLSTIELLSTKEEIIKEEIIYQCDTHITDFNMDNDDDFIA